MAKGVDRGQFERHHETVRPRKPPFWYKNLGHLHDLLYAGLVIANFVLKYPNFRYHRNRDPSETSCNDTTKLADPTKI